jgi:hypothetical protein
MPLDLAGGFAAAVGFEQADHHIAAVPEPFLALLEQEAGLAHPRRHAEQHLAAAAALAGANHRDGSGAVGSFGGGTGRSGAGLSPERGAAAPTRGAG